MKAWLLILVLLFPVAQAASLPPAFVADYEIKMGFLKLGKAQREFRREPDGRLVYISRSHSAGVVAWLVKEDLTETSLVEWVDGRVRPLFYRKRRIGNKNQHVEQRFDWAGGKVHSQVNETRYEFELPENGLDQSMYQLSLMIDLAAGKRDMDYPVAGNDKFRVYPIRFLRRERIATPWGELETVVIQRKEKTVATTMWCAPRLHYLPVRIRHKEKGNTFTATLQAVQGLGWPAP